MSFQERTSRLSFIAWVCFAALTIGCGDGGFPGSGGGGGRAGTGGSQPPVGEDGEACGNGILEAGELCDDGNELRGDGCHRCAVEHECIATHNGGRPASFGSVRIDPGLNPVANVTLTLPFGYDAGDPEAHDEKAFGRLAGCGEAHAYAVLEDAERIAHLAFDDRGAPQFVGATDVKQVVGVACAPGNGILYAVSDSQSGGYLDVRSFLIEEDGALTAADQLTVTFFGFLNYLYQRARFAVHPISGELWLTGYFRDAFGGRTDLSRTARISSDSDGVLVLAEQARGIGTGQGGLSMRFRPDGRYVGLSGVDGVCTAAWPVAANGILPAVGDRLYSCGYLWDAADFAWFRDTDQFHVLLEEELRVAVPDGRALSSADGLLLTTRGKLMESVYGSTGLLVVRPFSGQLHVYGVGETSSDLTAIDNLDIAERGIRSLTKFPCTP